MVDNNEKILVEVDYDNIVLIDPNKVIGNDGKSQERLVKQEDLVMYANLEAIFIPRTKYNIGSAQDDTVQPVTIATNNFGAINFLNPGSEGFFTTEWSDEITGKDTLKNQGTNQLKQVIDTSGAFYLKQKVINVKDTQTLGITNIVVDNNASQTPVVTIDLVDVGGRTLFEKGDESPYSVFFNLPYPTFYLTLKGYFGKAIRYQLILAKFTSELEQEDEQLKLLLAQSLLIMGFDPLVATICASSGKKDLPITFAQDSLQVCPTSYVTRICNEDIVLNGTLFTKGSI
jgi:hypothetical protein